MRAAGKELTVKKPSSAAVVVGSAVLALAAPAAAQAGEVELGVAQPLAHAHDDCGGKS